MEDVDVKVKWPAKTWPKKRKKSNMDCDDSATTSQQFRNLRAKAKSLKQEKPMPKSSLVVILNPQLNPYVEAETCAKLHLSDDEQRNDGVERIVHCSSDEEHDHGKHVDVDHSPTKGNNSSLMEIGNSEGSPSNATNCEASIDSEKHGAKCILRRFKGLNSKEIDELAAASDKGECVLYGAMVDEEASSFFRTLDVERQINLISEKEKCINGLNVCDKCKAGYNLLMLALSDCTYKSLVKAIVDTVCERENQKYKSEVVMGAENPEVFSPSENSLCLAARNHDRRHLLRLSTECVPEDLLFKALMEVGPSGSSAMSLLLKSDDIETLKELFQNRNRNPVQHMRETLYDPAMLSNFMQLAMSQRAINFFCRIIKLFRHNYLIPRPSELSRPHALMFYNSHKSRADEGRCIEEALAELGFKIGSEKPTDWTTQFFVETLKNRVKEVRNNCSLLCVFMLAHGCNAQGILGTDPCLQHIESLLPQGIPKVLIMDACRGQTNLELDTQARLRKRNIIFLITGSSGDNPPKYSFLPELAKQIEGADGKTSLQEFFHDAVEKVNNAIGQEESAATFTPRIEPLSKRIVLRRYDGKQNTCRICEEDIRSCSQQCMICSICHKWYHLTCLDIDEVHIELSHTPGFNWLCKSCYARAHR